MHVALAAFATTSAITRAEAQPICQCLREPAWDAESGAAPDSGAVRRAWHATCRRASTVLGNASLHLRLWRSMYDEMKVYMYELPARATAPKLRASRRGFALEVGTSADPCTHPSYRLAK